MRQSIKLLLLLLPVIGYLNPVMADDAYQQLYSAALTGSASAQFELGQMHEYGRGVHQDDSTALEWYRKSAAQKNTKALYRLGVLNDNGWGLSANKTQAIKYYGAAAEMGHIFAQHDLAIMYLHGTGTEKNLVSAYKWLRIAQLNGSDLMYKHLRLVATEMSAEQMELAEYLASVWKKRTRI